MQAGIIHLNVHSAGDGQTAAHKVCLCGPQMWHGFVNLNVPRLNKDKYYNID